MTMKVRIKVDDIVYMSQCLAVIAAALESGDVETAKGYVKDLFDDVNDALKAL